MNYKKHYDKLIHRAIGRELEGYKESHHIIPRCIGGGEEPENLVNLTAAEHYVAHQLLVKIYPKSSGLSFAALTMSKSSLYLKRNNNKQYEWLRKRHSANISKQQTGKVYYNNGTKSIRIDPNIEPPEGFTKGRHYGPTKGKTPNKKSHNSCFADKNLQHMLNKRRWDRDRDETCERFGMDNMEDVRRYLIELKDKQHPRFWIKPILKMYPFLGRVKLINIVRGGYKK